ncbi:hypothetical protein BJ138DRAFT_1104469 [Hygrophoropsis aurantiaca]|uniref:Uncharacterized protein n=1 Tax=Hygrophoropsis aurantiaca TaxID=72124 RepID=A0ACB8A130_9AGAM|nr:hypothetical protein BJ138DRAFT_1104469 [Hygrophoropsis aurantiaca]
MSHKHKYKIPGQGHFKIMPEKSLTNNAHSIQGRGYFVIVERNIEAKSFLHVCSATSLVTSAIAAADIGEGMLVITDGFLQERGTGAFTSEKITHFSLKSLTKPCSTEIAQQIIEDTVIRLVIVNDETALNQLTSAICEAGNFEVKLDT